MSLIDYKKFFVFDNFDENNMTFDCHIKEYNEEDKFILNQEDLLTNLSEFVIENKNRKRIYEYLTFDKANHFKFKLKKEIQTNENKKNTYNRYYCPFFIPITLENENFKIDLYVSNEENINISSLENYIFKLNNEEELKNYLLNLNFPIAIDEVYKKISSILDNTISKYPKFDIKISKKINDKDYKTTDEIDLRYGKLENFTMTKDGKVSDTYKVYSKDYIGKYRIKYDGKTISVSNNNSWKYDSSKISAYKNPDGKMGFSVKEMTKEEIENLKTLSEEMDSINDEVDKIKKLSKTL